MNVTKIKAFGSHASRAFRALLVSTARTLVEATSDLTWEK